MPCGPRWSLEPYPPRWRAAMLSQEAPLRPFPGRIRGPTRAIPPRTGPKADLLRIAEEKNNRPSSSSRGRRRRTPAGTSSSDYYHPHPHPHPHARPRPSRVSSRRTVPSAGATRHPRSDPSTHHARTCIPHHQNMDLDLDLNLDVGVGVGVEVEVIESSSSSSSSSW